LGGGLVATLYAFLPALEGSRDMASGDAR
jgi:hypothetical protein